MSKLDVCVCMCVYVYLLSRVRERAPVGHVGDGLFDGLAFLEGSIDGGEDEERLVGGGVGLRVWVCVSEWVSVSMGECQWLLYCSLHQLPQRDHNTHTLTYAHTHTHTPQRSLHSLVAAPAS